MEKKIYVKPISNCYCLRNSSNIALATSKPVEEFTGTGNELGSILDNCAEIGGSVKNEQLINLFTSGTYSYLCFNVDGGNGSSEECTDLDFLSRKGTKVKITYDSVSNKFYVEYNSTCSENHKDVINPPGGKH